MSVIHGDCLDVMAGMEPESVDAIVTDPPYDLTQIGRTLQLGQGPQPQQSPTRRQGFMGKAWDGTGVAFRPETWEAAYRVAKPSAYLLAFGGTRTVHRMTCAIEDAGWIIRDMLVWAYACLSDDTEVLTSEGWVRYNSASEGQAAAAFDPETGDIRWEPIEAVHQYDHEGPMALVGPQLVTLNHRVILEPHAATVPRLPGLWHDVHEARRMVAEGANAGLLAGVQRGTPDRRPTVPSGARVVGGASAVAVREDDRPREPRLEGRRYRVQEARELLGRSLCAGSSVGATDGTKGRLCHGAPAPDGRDVRLPADPDGMREPRGPRSDEQRASEPDALAGQPDAQALRMGQVSGGDGGPDAVRLVDGYRGVVWCITVPSGAFVARRNGVAFVTGNSGFPKSKASLKPAWEPIVMARKPGPLRTLAIDECRIPSAGDDTAGRLEWAERYGHKSGAATIGMGAGGERRPPSPAGRWPANVILTDPIFDGGWDGVVGGGTVDSGVAVRAKGGAGAVHGIYGAGMGAYPEGSPDVTFGDSGTYSRFFLIPKAARSDREPVLGGLATTAAIAFSNQVCRNCGHGKFDGRREGPCCDTPDYAPGQVRARANLHPTVKPTDLMRHLVRLVTPTGGVVLDPFLGSGTTALAAEMEGFGWVGIEREAEYVAIAEARLNGTQRGLGLEAS